MIRLPRLAKITDTAERSAVNDVIARPALNFRDDVINGSNHLLYKNHDYFTYKVVYSSIRQPVIQDHFICAD